MLPSNNRSVSIAILLLAAVLEAGGDALVRKALHSHIQGTRFALFGVATVVLLAYGYTVNAPAWDFGKLLGLYVVFFFVIAQLMSWLVFGQPPTLAVIVGGSLIAVGGVVIAMAA
jgi:small multidrug resistance family-3 protein